MAPEFPRSRGVLVINSAISKVTLRCLQDPEAPGQRLLGTAVLAEPSGTWTRRSGSVPACLSLPEARLVLSSASFKKHLGLGGSVSFNYLPNRTVKGFHLSFGCVLGNLGGFCFTFIALVFKQVEQ